MNNLLKWDKVDYPPKKKIKLERQNCIESVKDFYEKKKFPRYHELMQTIQEMRKENHRLRTQLEKWWNKKLR
tara:strand:- start:249 stop:464 length:216 start_codon:yes stop_codon:yes gene_type:complete